jgi:hypothetical protein
MIKIIIGSSCSRKDVCIVDRLSFVTAMVRVKEKAESWFI